MRLFYSEYEKNWKATLDSLRTLPEPTVKTVKRGILLPLKKRSDCDPDMNVYEGGVCGPDFSFVAGLERNSRVPLYNLSCKRGYTAVGLDVRQERVIFGGIIFGHFGHEILDGMTRLWHFARNHDDGLKRVFVVQPGASTKHAESFFKLAGMNYEILRGPTQFAEIIVPDEAFHTGEGGNKAWLEWFDFLKQKAGRPSDLARIYLTRTQWPANDGVGEEYYERFFSRECYQAIAPEQYPLDAQIRMIAGATRIATTMGTMAHMLAFARPDADITILLRSPSSMMPAQLIINKLRGYNWRMIDATRNPLPTGQSNGCFLYEQTGYFCKWAKEFFKMKIVPRPMVYDVDEVDNLLAYFQKWAKRFSDPANLRYIKNKTAKDFVDSLTAYFG